MLKDPTGLPITNQPHPEEFKDLIDHLDPTDQKELTQIFVELIKKDNYHNSYVLGSRYINTIPRLHELLLKAAGGDEGKTGRYFGLYLYITFMQIEDEWFVQRPSNEGRFAEKGYDYYKRPGDRRMKYLKT